MKTFTVNGKEYTKAEMRVLVAKDVLKTLKKASKGDTIRPTQGEYCYLDNRDILSQASRTKDSRRQARLLQKDCKVCALGAAFLSHVALMNNYEFPKDEFVSYMALDFNDISKKLKELFTPYQMALIEAAFEGDICGGAGKYDNRATRKQKDAIEHAAYYMYPDSIPPTERLTKIMENLVANNGTFVVPKEVTTGEGDEE